MNSRRRKISKPTRCGVHALDVGDHHADLGAAGQELDLARDLGRAPLVVVVEQREVRAGGRGHAEVARRRHPAVGLAQVADALAELRRSTASVSSALPSSTTMISSASAG
jgi:hypothetical protein